MQTNVTPSIGACCFSVSEKTKLYICDNKYWSTQFSFEAALLQNSLEQFTQFDKLYGNAGKLIYILLKHKQIQFSYKSI